MTFRPASARGNRDEIGVRGPSVEAAHSVCPFLVGADGNWRSATPSRDQHCGAVEPPVPLALEKQRRLCVIDRHTACLAYQAAAAPVAPSEEARDARAVTRWSIARTAPVVLDPGSPRVVRLARERKAPQLALGGVLALALVTIAMTQLPSPDPSRAVALSSPSPVVSAAPTLSTPVATLSAAPTSSPSATPVPTPSAAPTASPTVTPTLVPATRTYRVKSGDTLYDIARRFDTTVKAIMNANALTSNRLHVGQELRIP